MIILDGKKILGCEGMEALVKQKDKVFEEYMEFIHECMDPTSDAFLDEGWDLIRSTLTMMGLNNSVDRIDEAQRRNEEKVIGRDVPVLGVLRLKAAKSMKCYKCGKPVFSRGLCRKHYQEVD